MPSLTNVVAQKEIDQTISDLEGLIRVHRWRRNRHSAVSKLPAEILSQIFLDAKYIAAVGCSQSQPHFCDFATNWLNVARVCRDWYNIVLDTPRLWSSIKLNPPDRALEMLKRSKSVPLKIQYKTPYCDAAYERVKDAFMSQIHRVQDLDIPLVDEQALVFLQTNETAEASLLETLVVSSPDPFILPPSILDRGMPSLRVLALSNGSLMAPLPYLPRLVDLTLSPTHISVPLLLQSLDNTPNLECISVAHLEAISSSSDDLPIVALPHLSRGCIISCDIHGSSIFDALRHPKTTTMHYTCEDGQPQEEELSSLKKLCARYFAEGALPILKFTVRADAGFVSLSAHTSEVESESATLAIALPNFSDATTLPGAYIRLCSAFPISTVTTLALYGLPRFASLLPFKEVKALELLGCSPDIVRSLLKEPRKQLPMPRLRQIVLINSTLSITHRLRNEAMCSALRSVINQRKAMNLPIEKLVLTRCSVSRTVVKELKRLVKVEWDGSDGVACLDEEEEGEDDDEDDLGPLTEAEIAAYLFGGVGLN
ncbi:hypothetical protein ONZ45_g12621 [Pleurotus djamor]|nr:hypothetical protein ONZ45_g12621 [Pleurotus djamor]